MPITIILTLILTTAFALYWGAVLSLRLPEISRHFDRRPFNCRPCLTFHLAWSVPALLSLVLHLYYLLPCGIIVAFALFVFVKIIDNKKIEK